MSRRRKNPHPKRAVNARTVLKAAREEEEVEEEEPVLCLRIPDEDDDLEANHHQIRKEEEADDDAEQLRRILCVPCDDVEEQNQMREEETAFIAKAVKRKRTYECDVCEKCFSQAGHCLLYTSPSPRDQRGSRMPSSA